MREKQKYYTPDISDLKVGYEFEEFTGTYKDQEDIEKVLDSSLWKKRIIHADDLKTWGADAESEINDIVYSLERNRIRSSCLTKEQIEAEGWKLLGILKENTIIAYLKKETIIYTINYKKSILTITKLLRKENMNFLDDQLYKGTCPSINEFRTICKLLNIK